MTFTHVVMFKWRDQDFDDAALADALRGLVSRFDGVRSYVCGADVGFSPNTYDFAIVGAFDTRESFIAYRDHPDHQQILTDMILPNAESRVAVQLED
jgi:hypothetical protein